MLPYTDHEFDTYPSVFFTYEKTWDPTLLNHDPTDDPQWASDMSLDADPNVNPFDAFGNYRGRFLVQLVGNAMIQKGIKKIENTDVI